jgi:ligand-binding sensor domain-containing protein/signal transduction histidine kinase
MNHFRNIVFILIIAGIFFCRIIAQPTNIKFDQIGLEQGLSQSTVNAIVQDAKGFMWFGTQDGLNRYDGYSIKVFKHDPEDSNSISDNRISCLLSDSKGDLWIGTKSSGVDRYNLKEGKFYHYLHNENDSLTISNNIITSIFEDSGENIWIGTNSGLNRYNRKSNTFRHFFFELKNSLSLNGSSITAICEDKDNNIWAGTYKGLFRYNLKNNYGFMRVNELNTNPTTLYGDNVTSLYTDRTGSLWVGTYDQFLKRYDKNTKSFYRYINTIKNVKTIYEEAEKYLWFGSVNLGLRVLHLKTNNISQISAIQNDPVNILYEDRFGVLWVGTSFRGTFIYDQNKNRFKNFLEDPHKPNNPNVVMAILEDRDGGLWIGTYGNGLIYFNRKRSRVKTYKYNPKDSMSISSDKIFAFCITSDGLLWVGTIGGGLNSFNNSTGIFKRYIKHSPTDSKGLSNNDITALYEDSNGNLLIGNVTGGIDILNRKTKTFTHYYSEEQSPTTIGGGRSVTVIREDEKGMIWAGTLDGIKHFVPKLNSFVRFNFKPKPNKQNTNYESITSLLFTGNVIWAGTSRNGLFRFKPESDSLISYTANEGLPDNVVLGILPDNSGNLWLSTNKGISKFNPETEMFKNYDVSEGLQAKEFNQGAYFKSVCGEMFFGGVNGFNAFFPDEIEDNKLIPPIYLTTFSVFDEKLNLPNPIPDNSIIELSYSQNFFSFEFVALNFTSPEKNQYAYMLVGFDSDWHYVSAQQRYASYSNLDPGEYLLKVKGSNNDGFWNEEGASVTIIINPPFWMTWWFRSLGIFLFLSLVFLFYKRRITTLKREKELQQEISSRLIEKQEDERKRIALEIHDSLGPNLVFIKNRANLTMKKNFDAQTARLWRESFHQISSAASGVLNTVREISHNLRPPELDQLGLTETLRSIMLTVRESTTIEINGEVESIDGLIPHELEINLVRILQEALSNVLKHSEATKCQIIFKTQDSHIVLSVSDNGKGIDRSNAQDVKMKSGLGLTGMTERVRILGGTFEINSEIGKGTHIEITIPVKSMDRE